MLITLALPPESCCFVYKKYWKYFPNLRLLHDKKALSEERDYILHDKEAAEKTLRNTVQKLEAEIKRLKEQVQSLDSQVKDSDNKIY